MMPTHSTAEAVTVHLDPGMRAELDELARASARDPAAIVNEAVATYLDVQRWQTDLIRQRMNGGADELATDEEVEAAYAAFR